MIMGSADRVAPAMSRPKSVHWPWSVGNPTEAVYMFGSFRTIRGQKKSFQTATKVNIPSTASPVWTGAK